MKIKKVYKLLIIFSFIIGAIVFYISQYDTSFETLESDLKAYLDLEFVTLHETTDVPGQNLYKIVLFSSEKGVHVALINKGLNDNYQIRNAYTTYEDLSFIEYSFGWDDYLVFFGDFDLSVTKLEVLFEGGNSKVFDINNEPFLRLATAYQNKLRYVSFNDPSDYRLYYEDGTKNLIHFTKRSYNVDAKNSGTKLMVDTMTIVIALIGVLLMVPLHFAKRGVGPYKIFERTIHMEKDDMVRSQMRYY